MKEMQETLKLSLLCASTSKDTSNSSNYTRNIIYIYLYSKLNGPLIRAPIDSSLDLDPPRLVEKHFLMCFPTPQNESPDGAEWHPKHCKSAFRSYKEGF